MENLYPLLKIRRNYFFDNNFFAKAVISPDYERNKCRLLLKCMFLSSPAFIAVRKVESEGCFPQESVWIQMMQKVENKYGLNATVLVREKFEAVFSLPDRECHIKIVSENVASGLVQLSCLPEDGKKVFKKVKINMRDFDEILYMCRLCLQEVSAR